RIDGPRVVADPCALLPHPPRARAAAAHAAHARVLGTALLRLGLRGAARRDERRARYPRLLGAIAAVSGRAHPRRCGTVVARLSAGAGHDPPAARAARRRGSVPMNRLVRILVLHSIRDLVRYKSFFVLVAALIVLDRVLHVWLPTDFRALGIPPVRELMR